MQGKKSKPKERVREIRVLKQKRMKQGTPAFSKIPHNDVLQTGIEWQQSNG